MLKATHRFVKEQSLFQNANLAVVTNAFRVYVYQEPLSLQRYFVLKHGKILSKDRNIQ